MANTLSRSLRDVGLSAWFGGTLATAVGLNEAAAQAGSPARSGAVANAGWGHWTPVNAAAIGLHLAGSLGQLAGNAERLKAQQGVGTMSLVKTGVTAAALGVTAYSRLLGKKVSEQHDVSAQSGTEPTVNTPTEVARAQRRLALLQWAVPALTGALVVISAFAGEQQRPHQVVDGITARLRRNG